VNKHVVTIGEIVVEIMAVQPGNGFCEPLELIGPYPSGAPAIFIDQLARQGQPCGIVSCVGNDDFGRLNLDRLRRDGVDISAVRIHEEAATGSAFVRYRHDGQRDFVYNIRHSANQYIELDDRTRTLIARADHLHVMGSSLFSANMIAITDEAMREIKARGGTVSFDPNIRKEMLGFAPLRQALERILDRADLFLPSGDELFLFAPGVDEETALKQILQRGVRMIALKRGDAGSRCVSGDEDLTMPAFAVDELDPTGAGDCFSATFVAGWLRGLPAEDCLRHANAAGALAVMRRGPMEGVSTAEDITYFCGLPSMAATRPNKAGRADASVVKNFS